MSSINELAERAYHCALRRGKTKAGMIHHDDTICSLADEFAEFVIANEYIKSDHMQDVSQAAEELTDILIVCLTELYRRDINIERMILAKMEFNEIRI